ncbi:MAG: ABC transporter permease [Planctomycetia bacterium]|nr:ABC transporter permease [Planctomycetia bacterium]
MFTALLNIFDHFGEMTLFTLRTLQGVLQGAGRDTFLNICIAVGADSVGVVMVTGAFIGMVLAEQSYAQFHSLGMQNTLGSIINASVVRELGPVLAGVMLAGRVGCAMAAELATMKVTEQVDALACLGVDPVRYLAAPRFAACVLLIPLLTIIANFMGVLGGAFVCIHIYHVEAHYYWINSQGHIGIWDLVTGLIKPTFFGAAIAVIACQRGLTSEPGAQGVGRAATRSFVASFVVIIILDFFLAVLLNNLQGYLWPHTRGLS